MTALDSAFGLLSALTSLPAVLYYARAIGAAAVHPVRGTDGRIAGVRANDEWEGTFIAFLVAVVLVWMLAGTLNSTPEPVISLHTALGTVVVAGVWRHDSDKLVRFLLLLLLIGAGASRVLPDMEAPLAVLAGYVLGFCCAWGSRLGSLAVYRAIGPR